MKDYNGIEIPKNVKAEKVIITINVLYDGKHGEESFEVESGNLEEFFGIEDALNYFEIEYGEDGEYWSEMLF